MRRAAVGLLIICMAGAQAAEPPKMGPGESRGILLSACRVVAPDSERLRAEADRLVSLLRDRGGRAELLTAAAALDETGLRLRVQQSPDGKAVGDTVIVIGNVAINRALLPLYGAVLAFADAYYPGGDGYVVRTVRNAPARGVDTIVLGGSSEAGVMRAVGRAREIVFGLKREEPFPLTLEVELGGDARKVLHGRTPPSDATQAGYLYGLSGNPKAAEAAKRELFALARRTGYSTLSTTSFEEKCRQDMARLQCTDGFFDVSDYQLEPLLRSWALVCDSPVISPSESQAITQLFFNTLVHDQDMYWRGRNGTRIGGRHQTMGTSAFLSVVRFLLQRGNPNPTAAEMLRAWKEECEAYLNNAVSTFHDDLEGLSSYHSVQPFADYALEQGVAQFFRRKDGVAPLDGAILRAYASVDNMGYYCGTGTYEEARPGTVKAGIMFGYPLAIASCVNRDGRAAWLLRHFRGTSVTTWGLISGYGAHTFAMGDAVPEAEPRDWLGVVCAPLGEYRYSRLSHTADSRRPGQGYLPAPLERTFEKICFRDRFDADGQYLVVEGYQGAGADNARPQDADSIIRYTDRGVPWLIANTDKQGNFYRNAVFVSDGESNLPGWTGCELLGRASSAGADIVVSKLGDYNGADWIRTILWIRGRAFAVLDGLCFHSAGRRQVFCTFRTGAPAELRGREWLARCGTAEFHLLNVDRSVLSSRRRGPEGAAIPTVLRESQAMSASVGTVATFHNLFYASSPDRPQQFAVRPVGENAMVILDTTRPDGCPGLLAVAGASKGVSAGPFASDGIAAYIGPEGMCVMGGTGLSCNGKAIALHGGDGSGLLVQKEVVETLRRMWKDAAPMSVMGGGEAVTALRSCWSFTGLEARHPAVMGPIVTSSERPTSGSLDELVDGFLSNGLGEVVWENAKGLALTFDLGRAEEISTIELATGLTCPVNHLPEPARMPKDWVVSVQFSNDAFAKDVRGGEAVFHPGYTIEPLHKGTVYAMGRWRTDELKQGGRYVRILFPPGRVALREVYIRRSNGTEARFGPTLIADLDGDGQEEAVITADTGELAVLGRDGQKRWGHKFSGPVTCLKAAPLSPGAAALLVGTWEARLYCFLPDGRQQWMTDFSGLAGDLPVPFSICLGEPGATGKRDIIVGNYARVSFVTADGQLLGHSFAYGAFETMALAPGVDLTGDGVADAILYNVWATLSVVDAAKRIVARAIPCPRGEGLAFQRWSSAVESDPRILIASDNGLGVVRAVSGKYDWQVELSPLSCVQLADPEGDGTEEVFVGRRDGWLLSLSDKGEVRSKALLGDEVASLAVSANCLWVATGTEIYVLDGRLATRARFASSAEKIEPFGKDLILVLCGDGTVSAFKPAEHLRPEERR